MTTPTGEERVEAIRRQHEPYQWDEKGHGICRSGGRHCYVCIVLARVREQEVALETWKRHEGEACPQCHGPLRDQMALHLRAEVEESERVKDLSTKLAQAEQERDYWKHEYATQMDRPCHVAHHENQEIALEQAEQRVAGLEAALTRLASNEAFGRPFALGHDVVSRELVARLDYARAALTPPQPAPREPG